MLAARLCLRFLPFDYWQVTGLSAILKVLKDLDVRNDDK